MNNSSIKLGHIGLSVTDPARSRNFYETVLGFKVAMESTEKGNEFVFFANDDGIFLTLWKEGVRGFDITNSGLHHLALRGDSLEVVKDYQRKLREANVTFEYPDIVPLSPGSDAGGIFFYDPDGIRIEISCASGMHAQK